MRTSRFIGIAAAIGLTIAAGATAFAYEPTGFGTDSIRHTVSPADIAAVRHLRQLADQHADNCKANYDQCMKGCNGATSCSNQCQTNYNGCMQNGQ
jgi:hypothetical protein